MFEDKVSRYLSEKGKISVKEINTENVPPPQDPGSAEKIAHRRKAAAFNAQARSLRNLAAFEESHKRAEQLRREADVAQRLADENLEKANNIKHIGIDGMKSAVSFSMVNDVYIEHYGRKGMKWGQRIFGNKSGSSKTQSKAEKKLNKKVSKMSDQELQAHIRRMRLEKEYKTLSSDKKAASQTERGKKALTSALAKGTSQGISKATSKVVETALLDAVTKARERRTIPTPRG